MLLYCNTCYCHVLLQQIFYLINLYFLCWRAMGGNADYSLNALIRALQVNCSTVIINCADSGTKFKSLSIEAAG